MPGGSKAAKVSRVREGTSVVALALVALPVVGLGLSLYLWRAKVGAVEFICTGFSDCVSVNMSEYSMIGGIPVAAAGAAMYLILALLGIVSLRRAPGGVGGIAQWGLLLALSGALFSLYLTGIEAFVLKAYCIWCLVSWLIITVLTVLWWRVSRERQFA